MLKELTTDNCKEYTSKGLKVIEFYTTWCHYCKNQRIELEDLKDSDVEICLVDADECKEFTKELGVKGYPTFVILENGMKKGELVGFHSSSELLNSLMHYI